MSALLPTTDMNDRRINVRFVPILLQKSFWGGERKFLEPLMRFTRGDVRDLIVSSKIDHGSGRHLPRFLKGVDRSRPTFDPRYRLANLVEKRRDVLRLARSLPRGRKRNQLRQTAASLGTLLRNKGWLDAHTGGLWRNLVPRPAPRSSPAGNRIAQNAMQGCVCRVLPRGPSGFDIRTFDCARCDRVHIVTVATDLVIDSRSLHARSNRNRARR